MGLRDARVGDSVEFDGAAATVTEVVTVREGSDAWLEIRLSGHPGAQWITVDTDEDDLLSVSAWQEDSTLLEAGPAIGKRKITLAGRKFSRFDDGNATYSSTDGSSGSVEYADYRDNAELVSFEREDNGPWTAARGRLVPFAFVRINGESA